MPIKLEVMQRWMNDEHTKRSSEDIVSASTKNQFAFFLAFE
jgi:hypothetical protein